MSVVSVGEYFNLIYIVNSGLSHKVRIGEGVSCLLEKYVLWEWKWG